MNKKIFKLVEKSILDSFGFNTFTRKNAEEEFSQMYVDILSLDVQTKKYHLSMDLY